MAEEAGFQIGKRFYPFPGSFRLGDPVLVREVTGMDWGEFVEKLPSDEDDIGFVEESDAIVLLGLVAVAVWQGNPTWRRDKVSRYVQSLDMTDVQPVGGEEEAEERPPEMTSGETLSETSLESSASEDTYSDESNQNSSGTPVSVIGSPV